MGRTTGVFAVEVDDVQVWQLLDAVDIATSPYSLADWLRDAASPIMAESIIEKFGDRGGRHEWPPLADSTIRIKEALGVSDPEEPNDRTQQMLNALVSDHDVNEEPAGAVMAIPGDVGDPLLRKKLTVAQQGWVQGSNEMFPGAITPPRPVLDMDFIDREALMVSLQLHIMTVVEMMIGGSPLGGGSFGAGPGMGLARP
jgi:hypothetical protein